MASWHAGMLACLPLESKLWHKHGQIAIYFLVGLGQQLRLAVSIIVVALCHSLQQVPTPVPLPVHCE